jgi:hypothetical protein
VVGLKKRLQVSVLPQKSEQTEPLKWSVESDGRIDYRCTVTGDIFRPMYVDEQSSFVTQFLGITGNNFHLDKRKVYI